MSEYIGAMYGAPSDDPTDAPTTTAVPGAFGRPSPSTEVATIGFVRQLEARIARLDKELETLRMRMQRLEGSNRQVRDAVRGQARVINDMGKELDGKIDGRTA